MSRLVRFLLVAVPTLAVRVLGAVLDAGRGHT